MDYIKYIESAIEYIEENLKNEFNLADVAKSAGYSEYHFLRIFKQITQYTPANYIRKRRLAEIVRTMDSENRPISDIAFEYGFNSKENFTRAFKTEHNILPTEYKSAGNSLKLLDRLCFDSKQFKVTPKIVTLESFNLTGFHKGEKDIPDFWNLYNCKKLSLRLSDDKITADYGVSSWNYEKKCVDYFIGIRTDSANGDLSGTNQFEILGGLYAIFTTPSASHLNFINIVHRTWHYINNIWLKQSPYRCSDNNKYQFETYIEASRTHGNLVSSQKTQYSFRVNHAIKHKPGKRSFQIISGFKCFQRIKHDFPDYI